MSKVVVTGATGFIGRYVCELLVDKVPIVRNSERYEGYSVEVPDFNSSVPWQKLLPSDVGCIIHLAAIAHSKTNDPDAINKVNVEATLHLAREAVKIGIKRFVYVSTIGVNGLFTSEDKFKPLDPPAPFNCYTTSKFEAELQLKELAMNTGLELVIVRPPLVYGPNAPGNFGMLTKLLSRSLFLPFGQARNRRDFVAVQNLADLLVCCVDHANAPGQIFLASDCETVSIKQFTNSIATGLDKPVIQIPIPLFIMIFVGKIFGKSDLVKQLLGDLEVDSANLESVLGWRPPLTMEQAMASLSERKK